MTRRRYFATGSWCRIGDLRRTNVERGQRVDTEGCVIALRSLRSWLPRVAGCGGASHTAVAKVATVKPPSSASTSTPLAPNGGDARNAARQKAQAVRTVQRQPTAGSFAHAEYEAANPGATSGCLACHKIGEKGNVGPGQNLSRVGSERSRAEIERALIDRGNDASFRNLPAGISRPS